MAPMFGTFCCGTGFAALTGVLVAVTGIVEPAIGPRRFAAFVVAAAAVADAEVAAAPFEFPPPELFVLFTEEDDDSEFPMVKTSSDLCLKQRSLITPLHSYCTILF